MDLSQSRVLVTGGAGFIGTALAQGWAKRTAAWIAYDSMLEQVHGTQVIPDLPENASFIRGDVRDAKLLAEVVADVRPDVVIHLAAETGTGQSLDLPSRHTDVNVTGTARLLEALDSAEVRPRKLVLASSRAVYGEGGWLTAEGVVEQPLGRSLEMLARGEWDFVGRTSIPSATGSTRPTPCNIYGATKLCQEHLVTSWATARDVSTGLLRLQNVYGPGQSPINPYTGITTLFFRIANRGDAIPIYEDGAIVRDFVFIDDVTRAIMKVAGHDGNSLIDVGSGEATTIAEVAKIIARICSAPHPKITGQYRLGDVRSASCDMADSRWVFDNVSPTGISTGLKKLHSWMRDRAFED